MEEKYRNASVFLKQLRSKYIEEHYTFSYKKEEERI